MQSTLQAADSKRYAKAVEVSKRVRFDIERDVIRGRKFDFGRKFLPDGLSKIDRLDFLSAKERRLASQVQGRTYANMFGLVERFIGAKILDVSRDHSLGDQTAFEALVRFTDEELKHQEMFRRIDALCAEGMPAGYSFLPQPNEKDAELSELWADVFTFHAREESQHAIMDEIEWRRADTLLTPAQRDEAVGELIALVAAVDGILQMQVKADTDYFLRIAGRPFNRAQVEAIGATFLYAYRWQYIISRVQDERFQKILGQLINAQQFARISAALAPIVG